MTIRRLIVLVSLALVALMSGVGIASASPRAERIHVSQHEINRIHGVTHTVRVHDGIRGVTWDHEFRMVGCYFVGTTSTVCKSRYEGVNRSGHAITLSHGRVAPVGAILIYNDYNHHVCIVKHRRANLHWRVLTTHGGEYDNPRRNHDGGGEYS